MQKISPQLCVRCKGRLWCGLSACPIMEKFESQKQSLALVKGTRFEGSNPPGFLVTHKNYPNIQAGPVSLPGVEKDSSFFDDPTKWFGMSAREIISMRARLLSSSVPVKASDASNPKRGLLEMQEVVLSRTPVSAEFELKEKPKHVLSFSDTVAPVGARARLEKMSLSGSPRLPKKAEYFWSDSDAKAIEALEGLFQSGMPVHYLYKALSSGAFGVKKNRKLVPTRWSITSVDSRLSGFLVDKKIKSFRELGPVEVYAESFLGNHFFVVLVPREWGFEMLESWLPGAGWAAFAEKKEFHVLCDHEGYDGRRDYASNITGAYYAARLPVAEHLVRKKRQASVFVFREIDETYNIGLGVWVIRETMKKALEKKPQVFSSLNEAFSFVSPRLQVPFALYEKTSSLMGRVRFQSRLSDFS
ncbi:MAG: hypothetical protein HY392_04250 [Candidatus Diapherotrites archaeon]|nr:hypothetical protein [Candidatus Diapherotrites archaeon]